MSNNWNVVKPACCARWLVLPTVYSDALSYGEQLDKFCYLLNQVIQNNNILPDFIADMIKEYINSGAIGEVVRDILADYILNVKYPPEGITPAVGDGSADDTEAIQGCIDYAAANGGVVYFPYGAYLTQPLTMKNGVSLFGFDRYATRIVLKGGATKPLINGNVENISLINLTLDGNSSIQVNDINTVTLLASNVLMNNLILKDGYNLLVYNGAGGHLQINNVVFDGAVEKNALLSGNANVFMSNVIFNRLSAVGGICVIDIQTDNGYFEFKSVAECDKCMNVSGNGNKIVGVVENANTPFENTGEKNNIDIAGIEKTEYYSSNVDSTIEGEYNTTVEKSVGINVNGAYSENVSGVFTSVRNDTESKLVTGNSEEQYKDTKKITVEKQLTVNANSVNETVETSKTLITNEYDETVNGNKTVNANSYDEIITGAKTEKSQTHVETVSEEKTVNAGAYTENVTGNKILNADVLNVIVKGDKTEQSDNSSETVNNAKTFSSNDYTENINNTRSVNVDGVNNEKSAASIETVTGNKTVTANNYTENVTKSKTVNVNDLIINSINPIQYKTPTPGNYFDTIPFKDADKTYNVLVENANTPNIGESGGTFGTVSITTIKQANLGYNDDQLLDAAIEQAKTMTPPGKILWDGSDIHFTSSHDLSNVSGVDFNGSKIYMPSTDMDILFVNPKDSVNKSVAATSFSQFGTTDETLFNKYFAMNSSNDGANSMLLGTRPGQGSSAELLYICAGFITDGEGKFINECAYYLPSSGDIPLYNIHEIPQHRFEIGNCELIFDDEVPTFLIVNRSNTLVHDIKISGSINPQQYRTGAISFGRCCMIEIARITGNNPVLQPTSGYLISMFNGCSNVYVHDCILYDGQSKSWGCFGTNCLTNAIFERCITNRFDVHYFSWGYLHIVDCTCNFITYSAGVGEILISNVNFIGYSGIQGFVNFRSDSPGYFNGNLIIDNCTCEVPEGVDSIYFLREYDYYATPSNRVNTGPNTARGMRIIRNSNIVGVRRLMDLGTVNNYTLDIRYMVDRVYFKNNFDGFYANNYDHKFSELIIANSHLDCPNLSNLPVTGTKIINSVIENLKLINQGILQIVGCVINELYNDRLTRDSNAKALMVGSIVPHSIVVSNLATYSFWGNTTDDYTNMSVVNANTN